MAPVGLGCMGMSWAYGNRRSDDESMAVIRRALDLGANLLDTADVYGPFTNEQMIGRAIAGRRDSAVIATKCGFVAAQSVSGLRRDGSPRYIRKACEASLRRLSVDTIDLYYLHRIDPAVPVEESVGAMGELVAEGKVREIGLSEVTIGDLQRAMTVRPIAAVQMELSLWTREPLAETVPWCASHGVAVVAYSPLGRGFLTGTVRSADDLAPDDWRRTLPRFKKGSISTNLRIADEVRSIADRIGATPAQVAIAWVLAQGSHLVAIPGTKQLEYLEQNLGAASLRLSARDLAELAALPAPAGARYPS